MEEPNNDSIKKSFSNVFLFLDDIREPEDAFKYTNEYFFIEKYTGEDRLNTIEHKVNAKMRVYCAQRKVF